MSGLGTSRITFPDFKIERKGELGLFLGPAEAMVISCVTNQENYFKTYTIDQGFETNNKFWKELFPTDFMSIFSE